MICLDEMGPESGAGGAAKSYPGQTAVRPAPQDGAERARQEIDYGRRGSGYIYGAVRPS